jgi:hypothetical protein
MADRLKIALVESYTGAIAAGSLLSLSIYHFVTALMTPLTVWMQQWATEQAMESYPGLVGPRATHSVVVAVPQLAGALVLLAISLALVKWLYYPEAKPQTPDETPEPDERE